MVTILVSVEAFCSSASGGSRAPVTEVSPNRQTVWIIEFGRKFVTDPQRRVRTILYCTTVWILVNYFSMRCTDDVRPAETERDISLQGKVHSFGVRPMFETRLRCLLASFLSFSKQRFSHW